MHLYPHFAMRAVFIYHDQPTTVENIRNLTKYRKKTLYRARSHELKFSLFTLNSSLNNFIFIIVLFVETPRKFITAVINYMFYRHACKPTKN
jgi:hypothetical protein